MTFDKQPDKQLASEFIISKSLQIVINSMLIWIIRKNLSKDDRIALIKIAMKQIKIKTIKKFKPSKVKNEEFYLEINKLMKLAEEKLYEILVR